MKIAGFAFAVLCLTLIATLAQQPVGSWEFSLEAGIIRDKSGHGNDLKVQDCRLVQTKVGQALNIPAKGGRVWCAPVLGAGEPLRPAQGLGIIAWVRPLGTGQYCAIVRQGKGWGEEGTTGYRLLLYQDGVRFLLKAGRVINISGGKITRGQWNQVAATYNGKEAIAFINGEPVVRDLVEGPIDYTGVENLFEVGFAENGNLDGEIAGLEIFDHALSNSDVAGNWQAGKSILLAPEEITAERYAKFDQCSLATLPQEPFMRDRHTTLLAHMDGNCDADYSRWEGRAGGWKLKNGVPGRFGLAVELPNDPRSSGAPILYRGAANCNMQRGTCEFWMRSAEGVDLLTDSKDRYLLTILPEFYLGYGKRPGVHLVMRTHAATRSLQFSANTDRINWYSHLNGAWIADSARTTLHMPLSVLSGKEWHHVLCSWDMTGEGRIWLAVDGKGVTTEFETSPEGSDARQRVPTGEGAQIPCYKIFLGGSYFPEVYCPSAPALFDEFRIRDQSVASRLVGFRNPTLAALPNVAVDEKLMMRSEDLCRHFLDFTAKLQMGGGWEGVYTWPNLMPDESPGSFAAAAEDEYTMRDIVPAFLRAYEVFGDDRYLRVAENCGQMLVKTQDKNGAWCQGYIIMPDQAHAVSPGTGSIEEGTQTDPLRVLFWLWRITGKSEYREAAAKSAQFVLRGQKPDGAWPLSVNSDTMKPTGGGYRGYSTLNDGATLWAMKSMLMGWHLTQERQYLDSLEKAGQWLIKSQLRGKARGWAEQYSDDGKPAWAREFEPPATSMSAVEVAAEALLLLYDLTANDQYLAPLRTCAEWGLNMPQEHKGYLSYDPEIGEPVTAKGYKVVRFSDPAFKSASPYRTKPDYFNQLQAQIKARTDGPLIPSRDGPLPRREFENRRITAATLVSQLETVIAATAKPIAHLAAFQRSEFPAGTILNEHPRHGRHFWPGHGAPDVQQVLDYIQSVKVITGELSETAIPRYADGYFGLIDPSRDWHKTPLR